MPAQLARLANDCRISLLTMLEAAGSGHPGGSLSAMDILVALFFHEMKMNPKDPSWDERDRLVLSKGHAVPALYAVLAEKGAIPKDELKTLRKLGSRLQGHPDRVLLPFVEASTGSLGQGLSIAQGIALGMKTRKISSRAFCIVGDGEIQEGQIWEAAMSAPKFKLNNLICFVDYNHGQIDGKTNEVMEIEPLLDKWRSFRWAVQEINGHDFPSILASLERVKHETERPSLIVAHTVKGKGVSFMEGSIKWHGTAPSKQELDRALEELKGSP